MAKDCVRINGKIRCMDIDDTGGTFAKSKVSFTVKAESMTKKVPFHLETSCKVQGVDCFDRNVKNATSFFFLILVSGLMLNFMHELFHFSLLLMVNPGASMEFSAVTGFTTGTLPLFTDPSIPWWWWYIELLGPLIIVNFSIVLVAMLTINHDAKNPPFTDESFLRDGRWLNRNFLKAIAFTSSFTILVNTVFAPFYRLFYQFLGRPDVRSDLEWAWQASLYMAEPFGTIVRVVIVASVSIMVALTIIYPFLYSKRETGE
jgi:hypothetical protein